MNIDLLRTLTQTPGIASREDRVRSVVAKELEPLVDDLRVDVMGNLIATRNGKGGPSIAIAAHMDEIGFLVRYIDENGFIRLQPVGGFDPRVLIAQRVTVHTRNDGELPGVIQPGTKSIHLQEPGDAKHLKLHDLFVDLGMPGEDVRKAVSLGDMITLERDLVQMGNTVVSKALDDRLGVYVMLEAIRAAASSPAQIVAVATTQEEVGLRGATTSAFTTQPDIAIALDVTIAGDIPGSPTDSQVTTLGGGAAIKVIDSSQLANPAIVNHLRDLAIEHGIPFQMEILPFGGTDAGAFQRSRDGVLTGTISIPTRYVHTVNEMAHVDDIEASVSLLAEFLKAAGERSYRYTL